MNKAKNPLPGQVGIVALKNKYAESRPIEVKINLPASLDDEIEDYREYLGEVAGVNAGKSKVVEEKLKDSFKGDVHFLQWREKKAKEKAAKNKDKNLNDDIEKTLDANMKSVQQPPLKNGIGTTTAAATATPMPGAIAGATL